MPLFKQARGRKRGGSSTRARGNFVRSRSGFQQPQPRKKTTTSTTKLNINFEDTSCVICSREIKIDPVTVVLQDKRRLDEMLSAFCKVMKSDCPEEFDFRVEQFPFCRSCGFLVEELKEVHGEFEKLQVRLRKIKAKCAGKILETWQDPAVADNHIMQCDQEVEEVGKGAEKKTDNQTDAPKSKDKVLSIRRRIARRYQPHVMIQKLTEIPGIPLQWTNDFVTDFIECPKCSHPVPVPATSKFSGRRTQSSSGVYHVYEDDEIKSMLSDLVDCLHPSCSSCNTTITSDDGQSLSDCDDTQQSTSTSYLSDSLTDALIATRDAWIQDYLGQLFSLNYDNHSLWGSEVMETVKAEVAAVDTDMEVLDGENTSSLLPNRPSNPRPLQICHHCNGGFKQRVALKRHLAIVHGEGDIFLFKCNLCAKTYNIRQSVTGHLRQAHPQLDPAVPMNTYYTKTVVASDGIQNVQEQPDPKRIQNVQEQPDPKRIQNDPEQPDPKRIPSSLTLSPSKLAEISGNAKFNPVVKLAVLNMDEILNS